MSHRGKRSPEAVERRLRHALLVKIRQHIDWQATFYDCDEREKVYVGRNMYVATQANVFEGNDSVSPVYVIADTEVWQGEVLNDRFGTGSLQ